MNPAPTSVNLQFQKDTDHLNLLGVFHFVCAGLALLGMGFICLHYFIMRMVFTNPAMMKGNPGPPTEFFELFKVLYLLVGMFLLAGLVLNVLSGVFLRRRRHRTFSIFVAALNCLHIPLGTTLGVFTIIVLMRDSVRESYEAGQN
ncbi:MAG: hypothetical protein RLY20_2686 [Verrucomicrobiota bacterium]|jgi:hypothetical protein